MSIVLYQHNKEAYEKAVVMLESRGKAAIIHPTGTGKSFIGFQLCLEHPNKKIYWLSPSEYIFRTQLENFAKAGGEIRDNIHFFTYAKLSYMSAEEIAELHPDYIILDEFHRCGASVWGLGVEKLLVRNPDTPVLGLSATAIRYLDNQRDMADELFDGNVASEMTLGEAIVRGILKSPRYVLSLYKYADDLDKYERHIRRLKNKAQRDRADEYLELLKRALDKADGLDELFDQYMTERTGKYIVFCANYEMMQDAIGKAREWFGRIDREARIYSLYTADPESSESFQNFKADSDDTHLRLLYCIDALNEGVHVEDIAGVILLRPTVSPIIYKQQIGRTLSAGKEISGEPVVFDIVGNIENLYSIASLRAEMETSIHYIHGNDETEKIVNERFEILGELKNCLELFRELENVLSSSWDVMYLEAKKYFEQYGNLAVKQQYINEAGYPVGRWVHTQRQNYKKGDVSLTEERIEKLNAIGMEWQCVEEKSWNVGYRYAKTFFEENGHLDIPATYVTENGFALGGWYRHVRLKYQEGRLEEGYAEALENIGMKWEMLTVRKWKQYYSLAKQYQEENGNLNVAVDYVTDAGIKLGVWISAQRENYSKNRLTTEQIDALESIGMSWNRFDSRWDLGFSYAAKYVEEYGDINAVSDTYKPDGFKLLQWVRTQRARYKSGKLSSARILKLEEIGIIWNPQKAAWECGYTHARAYMEQYGNLQVPAHYICEDGYKLKSWLNNQGIRYKDGRLSDEQRMKLESIGMEWGNRSRKAG